MYIIDIPDKTVIPTFSDLLTHFFMFFFLYFDFLVVVFKIIGSCSISGGT